MNLDILNYFFSKNDKTILEKSINVIGFITITAIVLYVFGFIQTEPKYVFFFNFLLKIGVSIFLIYRFNPFSNSKNEFTNLDRKLIVSVSIFNLILSFSDIITYYIEYIHNFINK